MTTFLVSFLLSFAVALALTPAMIALARRLGTFDDAGVSHRKIHAEEIPRLGGVAIVFSFFAPIVGLSVYSTKVGDALLDDPALAVGLLGGGAVIALLGLFDDIRDASPKLKLLVQVGVAVGLAWMGFRIDRVDLPFLPMIDLGLLAWPVTVAWIVGVTNAVNLIDGLDGLAAGIALFGLAPMVVLSIAKGNLLLALICCCLAGAILGFLVFNFHPARIFMGDTGSMFLGFVLAVVTVATAHKGRVAVAMLTPILALGLPILDTLLAIARRAWFGQSLFVGDRQHIHHRLLDSGLSHRRTVLVMYRFAALFAMLGLGVHFNRDRESALLFLISLVVTGVLLRKVGYLVMPQGLGGELGQAAAIRERNRLVRRSLPELAESLSAHAHLDTLATAVSFAAFSAGAAEARLSFAAAAPAGPVRTWTWQPKVSDALAADVVRHTFPVRTVDGLQLGELEVCWPAAVFHDALLPEVEGACRKLAERYVAAGGVARQAVGDPAALEARTTP